MCIDFNKIFYLKKKDPTFSSNIVDVGAANQLYHIRSIKLRSPIIDF